MIKPCRLDGIIRLYGYRSMRRKRTDLTPPRLPAQMNLGYAKKKREIAPRHYKEERPQDSSLQRHEILMALFLTE